MNSFVINGLVKRRAELAGDIEKTHETLQKIVLDLESLDATASVPLTMRDIAHTEPIRADRVIGSHFTRRPL